MNVTSLLSHQAATRPDVPAIVDFAGGQRRCTTFAELELASARAAALLRQADLRSGDAVLVFQPMSAELYIALAAIFRLGLVAMFLDPGQGQAHIEQCCAVQQPKALIASSKAHLLRLVSPALRRIPHKFVIGLPLPGAVSWRKAMTAPPDSKVTPCPPDTPALLTFTSGSTGRSKGAIRSHRFLAAQHKALAGALELAPGQTHMATMPIVLLANLASGVTSVIPPVDLRYPGQIKPERVVPHILSERATALVASPALLESLVTYCLSRQIMLPPLQRIFSGGAPLFPQLLDQVQRLVPDGGVTAVYGSTEAEPIAKIAYQDIRAGDVQAMLRGDGLLVGLPEPSTGLAVIPDRWGAALGPYGDREFKEQCCPTGEIGEIVVSGDHVLSGYLHGRGDKETKISVGGTIWHRTGDAGYLDNQKRLWLMGRCSAQIDDQYGRLYPFAVECAANHRAGVRRAALVSHRGQRLLVVEAGGRRARLATLKKTLAWAHIAEIRVVKQIPVDKRHNAKIDYPALHNLLARG